MTADCCWAPLAQIDPASAFIFCAVVLVIGGVVLFRAWWTMRNGK